MSSAKYPFRPVINVQLNLILDTQKTLGGKMGNRETLFAVTQGEYITKRRPDIRNNVENIAPYLETT